MTAALAVLVLVAALAAVVLVLVGVFGLRAWREREIARVVSHAVVAALAAFVLLVAGEFAWVVWYEHDSTLCGFESSKPASARAAASGYHVRWDYTPPGWVCVYTDRSGRVVAEQRP